MKRLLAGFCTGLGVALLVVSAFLWKNRGSQQIHRVMVDYPSRWDPGELRNCGLGRPRGFRWPELHCDGRGSHGDALQGVHAFAMDVRFLGNFVVPTDERTPAWTCQSSAAGTGDLTCRDWQ